MDARGRSGRSVGFAPRIAANGRGCGAPPDRPARSPRLETLHPRLTHNCAHNRRTRAPHDPTAMGHAPPDETRRTLSTSSSPQRSAMSTTSSVKIPQGGKQDRRRESRRPTTRSFRTSRATASASTSRRSCSRWSTPPCAKAYGGKRKIHWMEVFAGREVDPRLWRATSGCPRKRSPPLKEYSVSIKGPMTTPVGGGIRSLNVALRQELDLYVCLRPVRYFRGVPSPAQGRPRRSTW